jgi:DNA-binding transcriptional MerR regulator
MNMSDNLNRESFMAKDIKSLLDITPGQLFHWGKTWKLVSPEIKAEGRQGKDKYSFIGLLVLSLIKELINLGVELRQIQKFMQSRNKGKGIFEEVKEREALEERKHKHFLLISELSKSSLEFLLGLPKETRDALESGSTELETYRKILERIGTLKGGFEPIVLSLKPGAMEDLKVVLLASRKAVMVNLSAIVRELESKTGERL